MEGSVRGNGPVEAGDLRPQASRCRVYICQFSVKSWSLGLHLCEVKLEREGGPSTLSHSEGELPALEHRSEGLAHQVWAAPRALVR